MDYRLALMCGIDIPIPECKLILHQPRIKEIAYVGEKDFFVGLQSLCVNKNLLIQDKTLLKDTSNFQIFMTLMTEKETIDKKKAVQQIIPLFFTEYGVLFTPRSMILRNEKESVTIDSDNFDFIAQRISEVCCLRSDMNGASGTFNPVNDEAARIAQKLMRGRQRVAEQKGEENTSVFTQYLSALTIALQTPLQDLMELTIFQLYDLVERYGLYINWDLDIRARLAGASSESKPDNWMKNIH